MERCPDQGKGFVYALTEAGKEFVPLVSALGVWGQRWTRRELQEHEIDLGLLVWSIESSVRADCFVHPKVLDKAGVDRPTRSKTLMVVHE